MMPPRSRGRPHRCGAVTTGVTKDAGAAAAGLDVRIGDHDVPFVRFIAV
jgi:hypothetical protein